MKQENQNEFRKELSKLINKYSKENGSNTPDYILARYLDDCLKNFDKTIKLREVHESDNPRKTSRKIKLKEIKNNR